MAQEDIMTSSAEELSLEDRAALEYELEQELEAAQRQLEEEEAKRKEVLASLGRSITAKYKDRLSRRSGKEQGWIKAIRNYLGPLGNGNLSKVSDVPFYQEKVKRRPERNIVFTKCEIAIAQLCSMQFAGDEKNFQLLPPNGPNDIPDATDRLRKMTSVVADQLEACNYKMNVYKALKDLVVLGTGIIKGPVNSGKPTKRYTMQVAEDGSEVWVPELAVEKVPEIKWVNLWYALPDDSVTSLNDIEDFIQIHPMSKHEFANLRKNDAFQSDVIEEIMEKVPDESIGESMTDFASTTDTNSGALRNKYVVLEYHGPVTSTQLETLEIDPPYAVPDGQDYYGEIWVCNDKVIRLELENIEGQFRPPYSGDVWQEDPASPFGFGVAEKLADAQKVVNQAWHMILDNSSASSAPQIVINEEMIEPRDGEYELAPGKIWYFTEISGDVQSAFQFFNTPNVIAEIFPVLDAAKMSAEEELGISMLSAGLQSPEVTSDTATGQAIMQRAATVLLDQKSDSWDINAVTPRMRAMYDWNMQYNPDPSIKMDMVVRVRPATTYRNKQQFIRDLEKISVELPNNPALQKEINPSKLTAARLAGMHLPSQDILYSAEEKAAMEEQAANNPPPPSPEELKHQADMRRLDIEEKRLEIEAQKIQFELVENQKREEWEHRERLANTYARIAEAEGQTVKSQNEKEIALINLAAKQEDAALKAQYMMGIERENNATKKYLAGLQLTDKLQNNLLVERELDIKERTGSGI